MTPTQREVFSLLFSGGPHHMRRMSRLLNHDRKTIERNVYQLEKRGLIVTRIDGCARECRVAPWTLL